MMTVSVIAILNSYNNMMTVSVIILNNNNNMITVSCQMRVMVRRHACL